MSVVDDQYRIIQNGAGWRGVGERGRLRLEGRDAVTFLQALVSQDLAGLSAGRGAYSTYLTPTGRMLADLRVYHLGEWLLVGVPFSSAESLSERLDRSVFSEDVRVSNISASLGQLRLVGGGASQALGRALTIDPGDLDRLPLWGNLTAGDVIAARTDDTDLPSFDLFMASRKFDGFVQGLEDAGAVALDADLSDALRVDAGRPLFGVDMSTETIPLEAGLLDRAISTSKGCYVGQEVIVRVLHRGGGRVAKRLVRLAIEGTNAVSAGAGIFESEREVGRVTSAAWSPAHHRWAGLGYVHRDSAEAGRAVAIRGEGSDATATIVGLAG